MKNVYKILVGNWNNCVNPGILLRRVLKKAENKNVCWIQLVQDGDK
jgi:hypothetical protein